MVITMHSTTLSVILCCTASVECIDVAKCLLHYVLHTMKNSKAIVAAGSIIKASNFNEKMKIAAIISLYSTKPLSLQACKSFHEQLEL